MFVITCHPTGQTSEERKHSSWCRHQVSSGQVIIREPLLLSRLSDIAERDEIEPNSVSVASDDELMIVRL